MHSLSLQALRPVEPPPQSGEFPIPTFRGGETSPANDFAELAAFEVRSRLGEIMPALHRRARYLARSRAEADDLVHDTVERALRFATGYQSGTNLRAWLLQIMYTVFASRCRRGQREKLAHQTLGSDPTAWSTVRSEPADGRTMLGSFVDQLKALPVRYAEVLWLVDYQEYSYSEAAEALAVPIGTVMSRLHRARRLMRSALDPRVAIA